MSILNQHKIADTLAYLHQQAAEQQKSESRPRSKEDAAKSFMAITAEQGKFLYFLASITRAKHIIEFGCSFGISTIYLAAAARNNGGLVTTTEMEAGKVTVARANLSKAGLSDVVDILQGDAKLTLDICKGPVDFLFLDGEKSLYLPVFEILRDRLQPGAVIVADNIDKPATHDLVNLIENDSDHFNSVRLFDNRALVAYVI